MFLRVLPKETHIDVIWSELKCLKDPSFCFVAAELSSSLLCCGSMCSAAAGRLCLVGRSNEQMFCLFTNRSTSVPHFLPRSFYIKKMVFALLCRKSVTCVCVSVCVCLRAYVCVCGCACEREREFTTVLFPYFKVFILNSTTHKISSWKIRDDGRITLWGNGFLLY